MAHSPGHVAVVPNFGVTEDVGVFLGHQRSDLLHRCTQLQVAQVQAGRQHLPTPPVVGQLLLGTAVRRRYGRHGWA